MPNCEQQSHENMQFFTFKQPKSLYNSNFACCKTKLSLLAMVPLIVLLAGMNSLFLFIMFGYQVRTPAWRSHKTSAERGPDVNIYRPWPRCSCCDGLSTHQMSRGGIVADVNLEAQDQEDQKLHEQYHRIRSKILSKSIEETLEVQSICQGRFLFPAAKGGDWQTVVSWHEVVSLANFTKYTSFNSWYWPPRNASDLQRCDVEENDHRVIFFRGFSFSSFQYGHVLHDLLPIVLWMTTSFPDAKLAVELDEQKVIMSILQWFDPNLFSKTIFIQDEQVLCAEMILNVVPKHNYKTPHDLRIPGLMSHLRQHISRTQPINPATLVVYTIRIPAVASHGRLLTMEHSKEVLQVAKSVLLQHKLPDEIFEFNGTYAGKSMSFKDQFRVFNSAYLVFGPHGTSFANVLWMRCDVPVAAIEWICGAHSHHVRGCLVPKNQTNAIRIASHWDMFGGISWVRYFHVFLRDISSVVSDFSQVDLESFSRALDAAVRHARKGHQDLT